MFLSVDTSSLIVGQPSLAIGAQVYSIVKPGSADTILSPFVTKQRYLLLHLVVLSVLCYILVATYCFCNASGTLHKALLQSILRAKPSFFDIKPLGMILNRFSKDVDIVGVYTIIKVYVFVVAHV